MMITVVITFCLFVTVKTSNDSLQVQTEKIGENVVIKCEESLTKDNQQYSFAWFKQRYGKLPQLVVRFYDNNSKVRPARQFIQRFNATLKGDQFVLNIQKTVEEDSGTYFCVRVKTDVTEFGSGTLLIFNAEKSKKQNLTEIKMKSGKFQGSLQCSVLMATLSCSENHSVYWFRPDSGEPRPGIIFTQGDSSSPCTRSSEKDTRNWIVAALSIFSVISVIVIVVLAFLLLKKQQKGCRKDPPSHTNQDKDTDALNYAAIQFKNKPPPSGTPKVQECQDIYSQVKVR